MNLFTCGTFQTGVFWSITQLTQAVFAPPVQTCLRGDTGLKFRISKYLHQSMKSTRWNLKYIAFVLFLTDYMSERISKWSYSAGNVVVVALWSRLFFSYLSIRVLFDSAGFHSILLVFRWQLQSMCQENEEREGRLQDSKEKKLTLRMSYEGGNAFSMLVIRPQGCEQCF